MKMILAVLIAVCLAPGIVEGSQLDSVLTLEQALELAVRNNRTVQNANLEVAKAESQVAAKRTRRLPAFRSYVLGSRQLSHVDLKFRKGDLGFLEGIGPLPAEDTTIHSPGGFSALFINEVSQPLSQLIRIGLAIKQAELDVEVAQQNFRAARQDVVAEVKKAYYAILETQSRLRATEYNIRLYTELDRVTEEYVLQRVSLKSESLEVKTRLAQEELQVLSLQDLMTNQKEQLNDLLGRDLRTEFSVSLIGEAMLANIDLTAAQARALAQRPEIEEARLKARQSALDRRSKKSEFLPDVSLTFSNTTPLNYSDVLPGNLTTLGIAVEWEPFDWGRKKHELAAKAASIRQSENAISDAESRVVREVNANYRALQRTAQTLRVATLARETATESLRIAANNYRVNAALLKDVLQRESSLEQANDQYQQAVLSFWTAKSAFDKSLGEDHD